MTSRTLANIRKDAPEQDQRDEALSAPAVSMNRPASSRYVPVQLRPQTLEQLREACQPYGDAAVQQAIWESVGMWFMWRAPDDPALRNPVKVAGTALFLCRVHERINSGYPNLTGKLSVSRLSLLSADTKREALLVGAETIEDWKRAGSPKLNTAIANTYKYIAAYIRQHPAKKHKEKI